MEVRIEVMMGARAIVGKCNIHYEDETNDAPTRALRLCYIDSLMTTGPCSCSRFFPKGGVGVEVGWSIVVTFSSMARNAVTKS